MPTTDEPGGTTLAVKPRSELRHWSTYTTVGEWYRDHHGYVPIQMAAGLDQLIRRTGMSFPDAYRTLLRAGKVIHVDPADDLEPPPSVGLARGLGGHPAVPRELSRPRATLPP